MKNLTISPILVRTALLTCVATITGIAHSCSDDIPAPAPEPNTDNSAIFIKDKEKLATLYSIEDIDGSGRLYEVHYTADYKLDDALNANMSTTMDLFKFVQQKLFDSIPANNSSNMSFTPGCSAFATTNPSNGNFLMGRNYDFCHKAIINGIEQYIPISAFVVHTAPRNGKNPSLSSTATTLGSLKVHTPTTPPTYPCSSDSPMLPLTESTKTDLPSESYLSTKLRPCRTTQQKPTSTPLLPFVCFSTKPLLSTTPSSYSNNTTCE